MRGFLFVGVFVLALQSSSRADSEGPALVDLAHLTLEVASVEEVGEVQGQGRSMVHPGKDIVLKAEKGERVIVVTLKGTVPNACRIAFGPGEFSLVYEKPDPSLGRHLVIQPGRAVHDERLGWWVDEEGWRNTLESPYKPGPFMVSVAFVVPDKITSAFVRYPTVARGQATISSVSREKKP